MAGLTAQSLTYPLDRARAVMAVTEVGHFRNLGDVFRRTVRTEGVLALYAGFNPTMLGAIVYAGMSFFMNDTMRHLIRERKRKALEREMRETSAHAPTGTALVIELTTFEKFVAGGIAGLVGQTSSYPLDIVRRRMQTATAMGVDKGNYANIRKTILLVVRQALMFYFLAFGLSIRILFQPGGLLAGTLQGHFDERHQGPDRHGHQLHHVRHLPRGDPRDRVQGQCV